MDDEEKVDSPSPHAGKMPTWIWLAAGGGVLLLLLMRGQGSSAQTQTSDLMNTEVDAAMKQMQESMDTQFKQYKEDEAIAWADFKTSITDLVNENQGVSNPARPNPSPGSDRDMATGINPHGGEEENPRGEGEQSLVPAAIENQIYNNHITGFNYVLARR